MAAQDRRSEHETVQGTYQILEYQTILRLRRVGITKGPLEDELSKILHGERLFACDCANGQERMDAPDLRQSLPSPLFRRPGLGG